MAEKNVEKLEKKVEKLEEKKEELEEEIKTQKKLTQKAKASAKRFNDEFKKSLNTAVVAAFSFLIALAWRDLITEYVSKATSFSPIQGHLITALIVTIIAVIGIIITTSLLTKEESKS